METMIPVNMAQAMFEQLAVASASGAREDVNEGMYAMLIQSMTADTSKKTGQIFYPIKGVVLWPISDGADRPPESDLFSASPKGSDIGWAVFQNIYFGRNVIELLSICLEITAEEMQAEEKSMSPDEKLVHRAAMWNAAIGYEQQGGVYVKAGAGCFDGTTVIRVKAVKSDAVPKADGKQGKVYTNIYPKSKIPLSEVAAKLSEDEIARYFGSIDNFCALVEAEEALAEG